MTIVVLHYTVMITGQIRKARKSGALTSEESEYLIRMAEDSFPAASTRALVSNKGSPDFLYAALYFSTMIWQSGEVSDRDLEAGAGYKLAEYLLSQQSPGYDQYWAAKLLREFYDAHKNSTQDSVGCVA